MITSLTLKGLKSFRSLSEFEMRPLNVLIGQNSAGKSNFISLFRLLNQGYTGDGIQSYVRSQGGANALLHDGAETIREIECDLIFNEADGPYNYRVRLTYAANDTLFFAEERSRLLPRPAYNGAGRRFSSRSLSWTDYEHGHLEPELRNAAEVGVKKAALFLSLLRDFKVYQFHNTSVTARMRQNSRVSSSLSLRTDGGNLGPVLFAMQKQFPKYYSRLEDVLRLAFPQFAQFVWEPTPNEDGGESLILRWRERGSDYEFGAFQASDGTLRFMALLAILLQPHEKMPSLLILDEPELGLHPSAIQILAELIHTASEKTQIILATQSAYLLNFFEPQDVVVAERHERETTLRRLLPDDLEHWLQDYTLAQLWEKNVLGGKPL